MLNSYALRTCSDVIEMQTTRGLFSLFWKGWWVRIMVSVLVNDLGWQSVLHWWMGWYSWPSIFSVDCAAHYTAIKKLAQPCSLVSVLQLCHFKFYFLPTHRHLASFVSTCDTTSLLQQIVFSISFGETSTRNGLKGNEFVHLLCKFHMHTHYLDSLSRNF